MSRIQISDGRVAVRGGRIVLASAGDPCCCGPAAAEGYYAAVPCANVCDPSIAPPRLYIPASVVATLPGPVIGTLVGCYQIETSVLYWDCVFRGPPPPFGPGQPEYLCAPLDFYRPGRRYSAERPPLRAYAGCAACFANLYSDGQGGAACPGANSLVLQPDECPGCEGKAFIPPVPGTLDTRAKGTRLPWSTISQLLRDALELETGCSAVTVEAPSGLRYCVPLDLRYPPFGRLFEPWDGVTPIPSIVAEHTSCCACHAALSAPGSYECLTPPSGTAIEPGTLLSRPRCTPGVRPDWSLAYRCPPQTPIGKPCCCPGTPCHRRLRIRAKRVDTRISTGETTVQAWAGWAPGIVRNWALFDGASEWTLLASFRYLEHPACDPMALFQLLGRAGECGDEGFEVELAAGNCWQASYIERRTDTGSDLRTRIEYYAAFDTLGDAFPFVPELEGVPGAQQSTDGLLAVPILGTVGSDSECEGIPLLDFFDADGSSATPDDLVVIETGVVDARIARSWRVCQDGCSGDQSPFPEPGGAGGGTPGLLRTGFSWTPGSGGGCGECGGEGGL